MIERLSQEDGEGRYEYKVLRSYTNVFRNPERRRQILNEEARAGWELVAMLDNARLVVRRPRTTQDSPVQGIDPYRTQVDTNLPAVFAVLVALIMLVGVGVFVGFMNDNAPASAARTTPVIVAMIILVAIVTFIVAKVRSSRY